MDEMTYTQELDLGLRGNVTVEAAIGKFPFVEYTTRRIDMSFTSQRTQRKEWRLGKD